MQKRFLVAEAVVLLIVAALYLGSFFIGGNRVPQLIPVKTSPPTPTLKPTVNPLPQLPASKIIPLRLHVLQSFNNCGPASLSMQLSYFDIQASQQEIGQKLRPYQNAIGDNDDKSVTLEELAEEAKNYNLVSFHRPNGSIMILKQFIAQDLPVAVRTWTKPNEDIGHYRIIRGYDERTREIIQDDSLQDKNLRFSYEDILTMWQPFNYEFLVLVPKEKESVAETILGENLDSLVAWKKSKERLLQELQKDPDNMHNLFNISIVSYHLGDYKGSVNYFERVENRLPFRTLWYQIEPILAYQKLGNDERVFQITDRILNNQNRAFSELYQIRGEIYLSRNQRELARQEFQQAILYNQNYQKAKDSLETL